MMARLGGGLDMLRRRADFLAAKEGVKVGGPLVTLQLRDRQARDEAPRIGFTVTKRVGGAVERNRMKRRLRAAARLALTDGARSGFDYVLVARRAVLDADFERLKRDLAEAAKRAHGRAASPDRKHRGAAGGRTESGQ